MRLSAKNKSFASFKIQTKCDVVTKHSINLSTADYMHKPFLNLNSYKKTRSQSKTNTRA